MKLTLSVTEIKAVEVLINKVGVSLNDFNNMIELIGNGSGTRTYKNVTLNVKDGVGYIDSKDLGHVMTIEEVAHDGVVIGHTFEVAESFITDVINLYSNVFVETVQGISGLIKSVGFMFKLHVDKFVQKWSTPMEVAEDVDKDECLPF